MTFRAFGFIVSTADDIAIFAKQHHSLTSCRSCVSFRKASAAETVWDLVGGIAHMSCHVCLSSYLYALDEFP